MPVGKRLFRPLHEVKNFTTGEPTGRVVIRFVASPLKFGECARNPNELRLQCLAVQARSKLARHVVVRKLLPYLSHDIVAKCTRETVP